MSGVQSNPDSSLSDIDLIEDPTDTDSLFIESIRTTSRDSQLEPLIDKILDGDRDLAPLNLVMEKLLTRPAKKKPRATNADTSRYRRKKKLRRYARFQQMFKRNKKHVADMILNNTEESTVHPSEDSIRATYQQLYESPSPSDDVPVGTAKTAVRCYHPISSEELDKEIRNLKKTSPGPDNFGVSDVKKANRDLLLTVMNVQLWLGIQLPFLKVNSTTLIPKCTDDLDLASNWRPITVSSLFSRLMHKILAAKDAPCCQPQRETKSLCSR